jgi:hypothetical protein
VPGELRARALVGRDDELHVVRAALSALSRGEGGLVLVTGEAGVGKSRFLREVESYAREAGAAVLPGRAVPGSAALRPLSEALLRVWRGRPFPDGPGLAAFRPALARLVPGWSSWSAAGEPVVGADSPVAVGADSPVVVGEAVLELLTTTGPPAGTVLTLEDLHWADPATVAVLDHLSSAAAGAPVVLVATARSDEPGVALPATGPGGARLLELRRLDPDVAASGGPDAPR